MRLVDNNLQLKLKKLANSRLVICKRHEDNKR